MLIFTCPSCGVAYAVPDNYAGAICPLCIPSPQTADAPAPSPAALPGQEGTMRVSSGSMKGGSGPPDGAAVSTGRGGRTAPAGKGFKPPELPVKEAPDAPSRAQFEEADAWMQSHFYKKKGEPGAVGDEWKVIQAGCEKMGFDRAKDGSWRNWMHERWQDDKAKVAVVKALILAGIVKAEPGDEVRLTGLQTRTLAFLTQHKDKDYTMADLQAQVDPKLTAADLDAIVDTGKAYEPRVNETWRAM